MSAAFLMIILQTVQVAQHPMLCKVQDGHTVTLMFKALNGLAHPYLADDLASWSVTRFTDCVQLSLSHVVPQTNTQLGDESFSAAGPQVWNSLSPLL